MHIALRPGTNDNTFDPMSNSHGKYDSHSQQAAARPIGVSVVICCHNSAKRLPPTLQHLVAQQIRGAKWEVIVVDNSSTDDTVEVAARCWPKEQTHLFRIVQEPELGLTYARKRGLGESSYEFVCFVDDDNWLCPTWIEDVLDLMTRHSEVAVSGGVNYAVSETPAPAWFSHCKFMWAVSVDDPLTGDITESGLAVCGAGLTLRYSAWRRLVADGFEPLLSGRRGTSLVGNEDNELCFALRMAGWHIWVDPRLTLQHFLPSGRMTWAYARRLHRAAGMSGVALDAYFYGDRSSPTGLRARLREHWQWQALTLLKGFLMRPIRFLRYALTASEGANEALWVDQEIGRFLGLARFGSDYTRCIRAVRNATWRRPKVPTLAPQPAQNKTSFEQREPVAASDSKR